MHKKVEKRDPNTGDLCHSLIERDAGMQFNQFKFSYSNKSTLNFDFSSSLSLSFKADLSINIKTYLNAGYDFEFGAGTRVKFKACLAPEFNIDASPNMKFKYKNGKFELTTPGSKLSTATEVLLSQRMAMLMQVNTAHISQTVLSIDQKLSDIKSRLVSVENVQTVKLLL